MEILLTENSHYFPYFQYMYKTTHFTDRDPINGKPILLSILSIHYNTTHFTDRDPINGKLTLLSILSVHYNTTHFTHGDPLNGKPTLLSILSVHYNSMHFTRRSYKLKTHITFHTFSTCTTPRISHTEIL